MSSSTEAKKKHVFTWKVENFSMWPKEKTEKIDSPTFTAKSFYETSWCLELYPRGYREGGDGYFSCFLKRKDESALEIECDYMIELMDKNYHSILCNKGNRKFKKGTRWGWWNFISREEFVKSALFDDTSIIRCTICGNISENNLFSQNIGSTKILINTFSFKWSVEKLNSITHQEAIKFPYSENSHAEITIRIPEDDVKIFILADENSSSFQFFSCTFTLLDVEGKKRESKQATHLFKNAETWEFPTFIKKSQLYAEKDVYLKKSSSGDDFFTLQFDISVSDGSVVEGIEEKGDLPVSEKNTVSAIDTLAILSDDLKHMLADKIHTDIKLKAGKEVFPAHKSILCARSPVFSVMFDNDMAESQNGEVDIPDIEAEIVGLFLEYVYTGIVSNFDYENATKLIVAAEKYQVLSLKNKCAELLTSVLSDANVCEILATADLVQHDILKASAVNFIKTQPNKIFNSEKWKLCVKNNVELATQTVCEVSTFLGSQAKE